MIKQVLDLLAACCLIPGGHRVIFKAFQDEHKVSSEIILFSALTE